ncbi:glycosyltransferase [Gelidibacter japonicus]|uniref:glycosyltransferase family 2 protein n=1 Tax=Gelidibacter japonicus TaxID=1962232 RepID=UPI002021904A|nr:glycosyltransferase [Gelidibacter japonicus]MCL8006553.1 glycosyltransferase [Gelidibacter japonicus]
MLFKFLKYLQPSHYFQLYKSSGSSVFPIVLDLPVSISEQFILDGNYSCVLAQQYDASWRLVQAGYIGNCNTYETFETIAIIDEYRFVRKYFNSFWVLYVLLLRIFSFKNPIIEIKSWYLTRKTKRFHPEDAPIKYVDWGNFSSDLVEKSLKVSVIIPTLNRYEYLKDVFKDLEQQSYKNFEVIIVDQSEPYQVEFYKDFNLEINLIRQEEKALWLARNTAIKAAKGTLIALSEDDVRIQPNWIEAHLKCLDFFDASISAGVFYPLHQSLPKSRSYFTLASQFATGNALLYKDVFKDVGLFDRQFEGQRMGDGEFGLRVYRKDIKSISNPFAACVDVKAASGGLRFMGSWDAFRPTKLLSPRPIPSVLYFYRSYFGTQRAKLALLKTVPLSIMPYQFKSNKAMMILGVFVSLLLLPLVLFQVFKSWRLSSEKLKQGPMIEELVP